MPACRHRCLVSYVPAVQTRGDRTGGAAAGPFGVWGSGFGAARPSTWVLFIHYQYMLFFLILILVRGGGVLLQQLHDPGPSVHIAIACASFFFHFHIDLFAFQLQRGHVVDKPSKQQGAEDHEDANYPDGPCGCHLCALAGFERIAFLLRRLVIVLT
jgi:hypothetical protein